VRAGSAVRQLRARQVVVADAAALRCAGSDPGEAAPAWFARDAPGQVPLARWDTESARACRLGGALPARFAGCMAGDLAGNWRCPAVGGLTVGLCPEVLLARHSAQVYAVLLRPHS